MGLALPLLLLDRRAERLHPRALLGVLLRHLLEEVGVAPRGERERLAVLNPRLEGELAVLGGAHRVLEVLHLLPLLLLQRRRPVAHVPAVAERLGQLADLGLEGALGVLDLGGGLVRALPRDEVALPLVEEHVAVVEDLARLPRAVRPRHHARERDDVAVQ